jgi:hypothetical protein
MVSHAPHWMDNNAVGVSIAHNRDLGDLREYRHFPHISWGYPDPIPQKIGISIGIWST